MPTLQFVQPTDEQKATMQVFRDKMQSLYDEISSTLSNSRGKSLCLTKLEEAAFWINKAITHNS